MQIFLNLIFRLFDMLFIIFLWEMFGKHFVTWEGFGTPFFIWDRNKKG
jgi:hypothetical protein